MINWPRAILTPTEQVLKPPSPLLTSRTHHGRKWASKDFGSPVYKTLLFVALHSCSLGHILLGTYSFFFGHHCTYWHLHISWILNSALLSKFHSVSFTEYCLRKFWPLSILPELHRVSFEILVEAPITPYLKFILYTYQAIITVTVLSFALVRAVPEPRPFWITDITALQSFAMWTLEKGS